MKKFLIATIAISIVLITVFAMLIIFEEDNPSDRVLKNLNKKTGINISITDYDVDLYHETDINTFGEGNIALVIKICDNETKKRLDQLVSGEGWHDLSKWDDETRDSSIGPLQDAEKIDSIDISVIDTMYSNYLVPNSNSGYAYLYMNSDEDASNPHRYILIEYLDDIDVVYIFAHNIYI